MEVLKDNLYFCLERKRKRHFKETRNEIKTFLKLQYQIWIWIHWKQLNISWNKDKQKGKNLQFLKVNKKLMEKCRFKLLVKFKVSWAICYLLVKYFKWITIRIGGDKTFSYKNLLGMKLLMINHKIQKISPKSGNE